MSSVATEVGAIAPECEPPHHDDHVSSISLPRIPSSAKATPTSTGVLQTKSHRDGETVSLPLTQHPTKPPTKSIQNRKGNKLPTPTHTNKVNTANKPTSPNATSNNFPTTNNSTNDSAKNKSNVVSTTNNSTTTTNKTNVGGFQTKLHAVQLSALLKLFWCELLQNHLKPVHKILVVNHLKTLDFNSPLVRYAPNAEGSPLHLCAQYGFLAMAKMLVVEFKLSATLRNKVGSTPLHVACKFAQNAMVSWLLDDLHGPLDAPDAHLKMPLEVAPFDTIDKCVLAPLRIQYEQLRCHEQELLTANQIACHELVDAQVVHEHQLMRLNDTQSHVVEQRTQVISVGEINRQWEETALDCQQTLDEWQTQYDSYMSQLQAEQARALEMDQNDGQQVQLSLEKAQFERDELQHVVDETQHDLDRQQQVLVDQLGVFDASLVMFAGSKEVQVFAMTTLLAIASHDTVEEQQKQPGHVTNDELLLRCESVELVCHALAAFPHEYEMQCTAMELLIAMLQRLVGVDANVHSVHKAMVDSPLVLQVGELLIRWRRPDNNQHQQLVLGCLDSLVLEALYWFFRLPTRNAHRTSAFCQQKPLQLVALHAVQATTPGINTGAASCIGQTCSHAALVLLTQVKYGGKKTFLASGAIRIGLAAVSSLAAAMATTSPPASCSCLVETAQYLLAALALLTAPTINTSTTSTPSTLEDLSDDFTDASLPPPVATIVTCLHAVATYCPRDIHTLSVFQWAYTLLLNLVQHGGAASRRIRDDLLQLLDDEATRRRHQQNPEPIQILTQGIQVALACHPAATKAVQAGLNLIQAVWIERFNNEGQLVSTKKEILLSIVECTTLVIDQLLVNGCHFVDAVDAVDARFLDLANVVRPLSRAAGNPHNARHLISMDLAVVEDAIVKKILQWVVLCVDVDHAEQPKTVYHDPSLAQLLLVVLTLFAHLVTARLAPVATATTQRTVHTQSRDSGVCAVLRIFKRVDGSKPAKDHTDATEWPALRALCGHIHTLVHCTC